MAAYARLKRLGHHVTLGTDVPARGIVVYHKEDHRAVLQRAPRDGSPVLVACRADFRSADDADFEVVQNGHYADAHRCFFVPLWPQPGLIPRDRARGTRVENVAFKGYVGNLVPEVRGEEFARFLASQGMQLQLDTVVSKDISQPVQAAWHDYSDVDVVLAVRPGSRASTRQTGNEALQRVACRCAGDIVAGPGVSRAPPRSARLPRGAVGGRSPGGAATAQVGSRSLRCHGRERTAAWQRIHARCRRETGGKRCSTRRCHRWPHASRAGSGDRGDGVWSGLYANSVRCSLACRANGPATTRRQRARRPSFWSFPTIRRCRRSAIASHRLSSG